MQGEYYHKISPFHAEVNEFLETELKEHRQQAYIMDVESYELVTEPDSKELMKIMHSTGIRETFKDRQPYVKMFIQGLPLLMKLSTPGLKVLLWILGNIKPKNDQIVLLPIRVAKELGYTVTKPVHDGVKDLIAQNIIVRAYTGDRNAPAYWINPTVFYNGNRKHLYNKTSI